MGYSWFYLDGVVLKFVLAMNLPFAVSHVPKGFPSGSVVKNLPANAGCPAGDAVQSLGREDPLEKEMATHSSILAWKIPWTEEPGGLQFMGLQKSFTFTSMYLKVAVHVFFFPTSQLEDLISPLAMEPVPTAAEARSPNHWITGKALRHISVIVCAFHDLHTFLMFLV